MADVPNNDVVFGMVKADDFREPLLRSVWLIMQSWKKQTGKTCVEFVCDEAEEEWPGCSVLINRIRHPDRVGVGVNARYFLKCLRDDRWPATWPKLPHIMDAMTTAPKKEESLG
jgi:hypothetical protein